MPIYEGVWHMRFQDFGASETVFMIQPTLPDAATKLGEIIGTRLHMLSPDVTVQYAFVSDTAIKGDSQALEGYPQVGDYPADDEPTYDPTNTNLFRLTSTDGTKRALRHLRFIPSVCFNSAGVFIGAVTYDTRRATYLSKLADDTVIASKIPGALTPPFYTTKPIGFRTNQGGSHHKIGRPFALPVGRRVIR